MNKKILLGSIIAVVILVLVSITSAVDVKTNSNNDIEIISFITGTCTDIEIQKLGIIREVEIWTGMCTTGVTITGFKFPLLNPQDNTYSVDDATYVRVPRFMGFRYKIADEPTTIYVVKGVALGNIEWR